MRRRRYSVRIESTTLLQSGEESCGGEGGRGSVARRSWRARRQRVVAPVHEQVGHTRRLGLQHRTLAHLRHGGVVVPATRWPLAAELSTRGLAGAGTISVNVAPHFTVISSRSETKNKRHHS